MKKNQILLWLLHLVTISVFTQNKTLSSTVKSQFVNKEGIIQFVRFDETAKLNVKNRSNFLKEFLEIPEHTTFVKVDSKTDKIGILHETFQQYYNTIPVEFGIYKMHLKNGILSAINGDYFPTKEINIIPAISKNTAISIAERYIKAENYYKSSTNAFGYKGPKPTLVIFPKMENINALDRLAYRLDIYAEKPLYRADVYIDAHTGEIIFENNKIHQNDVLATGTTLYDGVKNITAEHIGSDYRLRQTTRGIQTFNATSGVQNATDIISSTSNFNANSAAVQVHWGTEKTYDYYLQEHNRNSFDDNGALIKSYITPQSALANAYWTGNVLYYSMGNGSNVSPLTSLDIVGHEITHAVVDHSADLIYSNQSGAINESFADIFGEMVEHYARNNNDWLCGADVFTGGLRSMSDPKSKGDPDTYLGQYWQTTDNDNFGVHTNSGVHNKWFYLLAVGGTGTNDNGYSYSVNGIGIEKAAKIAYRNLTLYLTPTSNYNSACESSLYAASQLFGSNSPEHKATAQAWKAVGLLIQPTDYIPPTTPLNLVASSAIVNFVNFATLSWDASTDNVGVIGYNIYMNESLIGVSNTSSYNVQEFMANDTMYNFKVQAFDAAGNISGLSNIDSVWFDTIVPTTPTNLVSSNTTQTTTDLSWTPATDNFGVAAYQIYQGLTLIATVTGTSYTVTGLTQNSNYNFHVKAIDTTGNESSGSNTVYVNTLMQCTGGNGNLTLTVNFSNTSNTSFFYYWEIKDTTTNSLVAVQYYYSQPSNNTLVESITLGPGTYFFDFFDYSSSVIVQDFELDGSSQVIIPSTSLLNNSYISTTPFCVDGLGNRASLNPVKLPNTKLPYVIYPNPVLDRLKLKNLDDKKHPFVIADITGKVIMKGEEFDSENSIDVSQLQSGLYILGIIDKEETEYHKYKFIKK